MKKFNWKTGLISAISFLTFFFGTIYCVNSCNQHKDDVQIVGDTISSSGKVMEFEYQKHKFINIVKIDDNGKNESFVVHDPNCKCMTKKLNNITTVITNTDNHNTLSSDSIAKANFKVILSKLNRLYDDNVVLMKEVKTLRTEVAMLKRMRTNHVWKTSPKKVSKSVPKKKR